MNSFWAKKDDRNGQFKWLSLSDHLRDTMGVAARLWNYWLDEGQKEMIINSMTPSAEPIGKATLIFLAGTHDISKCTPFFQAMAFPYHPSDLDRAIVEKLEDEGFEDLSHVYMPERHKIHHSKGGQALLLDMGVREDLALIVGSHHGRPVDQISSNLLKGYETNFYQEKDASSPVHQRWHKAQEDILKSALKRAGFVSVKDLPRVGLAGQVLLSGLLIMADWISSNEEYFPLYPFEYEGPVSSEDRLAEGWGKWIEGQSQWHSEIPDDIEVIYQERFGFSPRPIQKEMNQVIGQINDPGIVIFEAPMGIGKTEAALIACEQFAEKTHGSGLFFGLPTQATSNGIYPRVKDWMDKLDSKHKFFPRLQHGKAALNPLFESLSHGIDLDGEGATPTNQWFSGRKSASLDSFVIGTVDQLLLLALKQKHLALRHLGMSKKVVIVDEVHAYDAYMNQYLERALRWLAFYGVPVILLSATLTVETRNDLLKAYLLGKGCRKKEVMGMFRSEMTASYPLLTYSDGREIHYFSDFSMDSLEQKTVEIERLDEADLMKVVEESHKSGANIGIIVNTVKRAQELAKECAELFSSESILLLHSSFIATDRAQKEEALVSMLKRGGKRPKGLIVIGTQVIEQSLDLDFDQMVSDLAPMDLILQRIGRLHRHAQTERPAGFQKPVCYVLGCNDSLDFESGSSAVYGDYLLGQTQYYLPDKIVMPKDISPLVQKVYGESVTFSEIKKEEKHHEAYAKYDEKKKVKEARAENFLLAKPKKLGSIKGWLKNSPAIHSEDKGYAQVRDSEERIEVIALQRKEGGYGFFEEDEDISTEVSDPGVARKMAQHTITLPRSLSRPYCVDRTIEALERFTLKVFPDWQSSPWLKGSLGILFDERGWFEVLNWQLHYDPMFGLTIERMEDGEI